MVTECERWLPQSSETPDDFLTFFYVVLVLYIEHVLFM